MCRSTREVGGDRSPLTWFRIRAFYLRLFISSKLAASRPMPEFLTLVYLPRVDGNTIEVNGDRVRAGTPAFVALHRARSVERAVVEAVFASTDRVRVADGARFEAYVGAEKVLEGVFRRRGGGEWRMECRNGVEGKVAGVEAAEICVSTENGVAMTERVEMGAKMGRRKGFSSRLAEIPEETDGCDCCCCGAGEDEGWEMVGSNGRDLEEENGKMDGEDCVMDMEGVRWAVDVGIWVMCLGVGFLVSRASSRLRRKRFV